MRDFAFNGLTNGLTALGEKHRLGSETLSSSIVTAASELRAGVVTAAGMVSVCLLVLKVMDNSR